MSIKTNAKNFWVGTSFHTFSEFITVSHFLDVHLFKMEIGNCKTFYLNNSFMNVFQKYFRTSKYRLYYKIIDHNENIIISDDRSRSKSLSFYKINVCFEINACKYTNMYSLQSTRFIKQYLIILYT